METEITYEQLAVLKEVALLGSFDQKAETTLAQLSECLGVSQQTVTRRLQSLTQAGLIDRVRTQTGQQLQVTREGRIALAREWDEYRRLFGSGDSLELQGKVTDGLGKGQHFISLQGYVEQFEERLNYVPYPGTLNVALDEMSATLRSLIEDVESIQIEEWEDEDQTYGAAKCYPARLETSSKTAYEPAHVLVPDRTDHDSGQLEVIAPDRLRDQLALEDDKMISVYVRR